MYPSLPEPYVTNPIAEGARGLGAGMALQNQALRARTQQFALDEAQNRSRALQEYGQTRDVESLWKYSPETAVQFEKQLMSLEEGRRKVALEKMTGLFDEADKALPWFVSMSKTNPQEAAKWWPQFIGEAKKAGLNVPPGMEVFSPETLQNVYKMKEELKTAAQRVAGQFGLEKARMTGEYGLAKAKTTGEYGIAKEERKAELKTYKPEILMPLEGKGPAVSWTPGTPIPAGYGPAKGKSASASSDEDINSMVDGLKEGTIVPSLLSKRAVDYNRIVARGQRAGLDLPKIQLEYEGAKRAVSSLNSPQQIRLKGYAIGVVNTIDEISTLADQLKQSGITPLNRLSLEAKMKLAGNTPAGQLATKYVTAVNTLKEEFANLAQGGYAPTESVWNLANKQINENFGVDQMKASLGEIKRLINFRLKAFDEVQASTGAVRATSGGKPPQGGAKDAQYNTFKQALSGPNAKAAIDYATQNDPDFITRAKQERLIP